MNLKRPRPDLFGAVHLGYVVVETQRFTAWRRFGKDAVGLHVDALDTDTMRFRLDERACRFLLQRGPAEDVTALGWQVDDHTTFDLLLARAAAAGLPATEGTAEECALRGVERLWRLPGPKGLATELFTTALTAPAPLQMQQAGFVTTGGGAGMGHVAITAKHPEAIRGYYAGLFDARLTDWVHENISGVPLRIRFLRTDERHHSVAVAGLHGASVDPIRTRVQHLNIQVATLDDLLASWQRVQDLGFRMQWTVGQHSNDKELSYYCVSPSGFEWEVGWNPITLSAQDEERWVPATYDSISTWGHTPVGESVASTLSRFARGVASLRRPELTPGEFGVLHG